MLCGAFNLLYTRSKSVLIDIKPHFVWGFQIFFDASLHNLPAQKNVLQVAGGQKDTTAYSLSRRLLRNLFLFLSLLIYSWKNNAMRHYLSKEIKTEHTLFWGRAGQDKHIFNTGMDSLWNWPTYSFIMKNIWRCDYVFFPLGMSVVGHFISWLKFLICIFNISRSNC